MGDSGGHHWAPRGKEKFEHVNKRQWVVALVSGEAAIAGREETAEDFVKLRSAD